MDITTQHQFHTITNLDELAPVDSEEAALARRGIMRRHLLAALRADTGRTLAETAASRGVTKAAVHQLEKRPFTDLKIGSIVSQLQALGYDIDAEWIAETIGTALPTPSD